MVFLSVKHSQQVVCDVGFVLADNTADGGCRCRIVRIDNEMDNEVYFVADNLVEFIKLIIANQEIEEKRLD